MQKEGIQFIETNSLEEGTQKCPKPTKGNKGNKGGKAKGKSKGSKGKAKRGHQSQDE